MNTTTDISSRIVRILFFLISGAFLAFIVYGITNLITPIVIAFLLTFALNPAIDYLDGKGFPRVLALLLVLALVTGIGYLLFLLIAPYLASEVNSILSQSDLLKEKGFALLNEIRHLVESRFPSLGSMAMLEPENVSHSMDRAFENMTSEATRALASSLFYFILTPIITFFLLLQGENIYLHLIAMVPNRYFEMALIITHNVKIRITSYMKGLLIQMGIFIFIFSTGFQLISLPHAILVGLISGAVNIIPYAGPVIGLIPAIAVSLLDPTGQVVYWMLGVYGFALAFDMGFTQPVVLARSAQLHPLIALLSIMTAQKLPGVEGALKVVAMVVAIPLAGIIMMTIQVMHRSLKAFRII